MLKQSFNHESVTMEKRRIKASEFYEWLFDTIARLSVEGNRTILPQVNEQKVGVN